MQKGVPGSIFSFVIHRAKIPQRRKFSLTTVRQDDQTDIRTQVQWDGSLRVGEERVMGEGKQSRSERHRKKFIGESEVGRYKL